MRILNLHAGIGGNRKMWGNEHQITAVEYNQEIADVYKQFYPNDVVIVGDAGEYLAKNYEKFDFIWASPSCTTHSKIRFMASKSKSNRKYDAKMPNMELYSFIVFLKNFCKDKKWVVENVKPYYEPIIEPTTSIGRHLLWSNFNIPKIELLPPKVNHVKVTGKTERFGISLEGIKMKHRKDQIIRNCVNPEMGLHILNCAMGSHKNNKPKSTRGYR